MTQMNKTMYMFLLPKENLVHCLRYVGKQLCDEVFEVDALLDLHDEAADFADLDSELTDADRVLFSWHSSQIRRKKCGQTARKSQALEDI